MLPIEQQPEPAPGLNATDWTTDGENSLSGSTPASVAQQRCPNCFVPIEDDAAVICINCGTNLQTGRNVKTEAMVGAAARVGKTVGLAMAAGAVAAVVCGLVWGGIAVLTGYEFGYLAWGVGVLTGVVMTLVAPEKTTSLGMAAAGFAVLGIVIGKLLLFQWGFVGEVIEKMAAEDTFIEALVTSDLIESEQVDPEYVTWYQESDEDEKVPQKLREAEKEFKAKLRKEISTLSKADRENMIEESGIIEAILDNYPLSERLNDTLSPLDALWALLAVVSAFKIASGMSSD